ncbi:hypothetical protein [Kribbella sp. VKM Ac-2571]|uniref:hypothetical protein n=1 Tax=Kribbella sp. VKM Ac-2571 TaxID=2512222 RepID=UPI00105DC9A8|nr:hypothetical protein [Kribbella sp. VKM Ac-2571]
MQALFAHLLTQPLHREVTQDATAAVRLNCDAAAAQLIEGLNENHLRIASHQVRAGRKHRLLRIVPLSIASLGDVGEPIIEEYLDVPLEAGDRANRATNDALRFAAHLQRLPGVAVSYGDVCRFEALLRDVAGRFLLSRGEKAVGQCPRLSTLAEVARFGHKAADGYDRIRQGEPIDELPARVTRYVFACRSGRVVVHEVSAPIALVLEACTGSRKPADLADLCGVRAASVESILAWADGHSLLT